MKHIWTYLKPFINWRFLLCYGIFWFIATGWAWVGTLMIPITGYNWFTGIASAWLTLCFLPISQEKLVTIPAAIWLHKIWFGNKDPKTRQQLEDMYATAKADWHKLLSKLKGE